MRKAEFLRNECWILSWNASVQRAGIYRAGLQDAARRRFRDRVIEYAESSIIPAYASAVDEARHVSLINRLSEQGSCLGSRVLADGGYRVGVAQKLLNLQLKYLWCLDVIPEPPHCPVDRIILGMTRLRHKVNWTTIVSTDEYLEAMEAIRECAEERGLSIAQWELSIYDRRR